MHKPLHGIEATGSHGNGGRGVPTGEAFLGDHMGDIAAAPVPFVLGPLGVIVGSFPKCGGDHPLAEGQAAALARGIGGELYALFQLIGHERLPESSHRTGMRIA